MVEFRSLLGALARNDIEFILVGGVAATVHGSSRLTSDVDVVYRRSPENIVKRAGALDLLGEITGGGGWEQLADHTIDVEVFGLWCKCLDLDTLIAVKRAVGRPRDLETVAELEAVRDAGKEG